MQIHTGLKVSFIDPISKKKVATIVITRLNVGKVGKKKTTCSICDSKIKGGFYGNCHRSCPLNDKFCQTQSEIEIGIIIF